MSYLTGKDISQYQGAWQDTGEEFVMIKMSGGDAGLYMDSGATQNYSGAVAAGKVIGGYHFAGGGDPVAEADYFVRAMTPVAEDDVYALDWEIQHSDPVGWCNSFVNEVHTKIGVWPLLYINLSTLNSYDWSPVLANCGLWLADWAVSPDDNAPTNGITYVMQQYADGPGYDRDAFFGTREELQAYGYHAQTTPVEPSAPVTSPTPPPVEPTDPPIVTTPEPQSSPSPSAPVENPDGSTTIPVTVKPKPVVTGPDEIEVIEGDVKMVLGKYNKVLVAFAGTLVSFLAAHYGANPIVKDVIDVLTVLGVYQIKNEE